MSAETLTYLEPLPGEILATFARRQVFCWLTSFPNFDALAIEAERHIIAAWKQATGDVLETSTVRAIVAKILARVEGVSV